MRVWANIPVTDCSEGAYTSEKVAQNHEVVRKICEWTDNQDQISAVLTMRLESLCERGARVFRIKVMNSFFDIGLKRLRSGIYLHKGITAVEAVWCRIERSIKIESADHAIWNQFLEICLEIFVSARLSPHFKTVSKRPIACIKRVVSLHMYSRNCNLLHCATLDQIVLNTHIASHL